LQDSILHNTILTIVMHTRPFSVCMTGHYNTFFIIIINTGQWSLVSMKPAVYISFS